MVQLFQMWALVEVLGLVCLPLSITVFHNLPDRGWAFSKAIGMALLAFCAWLPLMFFRTLPFSQVFIAGVLLILMALNLLGFLRTRHAIIQFMRSNIFYILACEVVFLGMMFLLGWIRSYGPDIRSYEMFMDEGFLAAIIRSPHFPPNDMWLSGYPINYYYYAHYTIAVLAKLLGQPASIAFNTGICTFFGLTAVNLFGVTCNIVAWARHLRTGRRMVGARVARLAPVLATPDRPDTVLPSLFGTIPYGLLTIIMGLVLGNLAATQNWWRQHGDLSPYYWFDQSRVVDKTINEFPAFSFLLSCFHAHVLALAFTIVAIALALNLFLEAEGRGLRIFGRGWRLPLTLGTTAMILGGLFTMNGWDFPTYLGIILICIVLQQWLVYQSRLCFELILDVFTVGASLTALSFFLYAPFYLNFISPSQGLGIVGPADRSPLGNEILIYGIFAFVFLSMLVTTLLKARLPVAASPAPVDIPSPTNSSVLISGPQRSAAERVSIFRAPLASHDNAEFGHNGSSGVTLSAVSSQSSQHVTPSIVGAPLAGALPDNVLEPDNLLEKEEAMRSTGREGGSRPAPTMNEADEISTSGIGEAPLADVRQPKRLPDWLDSKVIGVFIILGAGLLTLSFMRNSLTFVVVGSIAAVGAMLVLHHLNDRSRAFTLLSGSIAFGLVAVCEILFLKDVFADSYPRMNTVFKFYFQSWAMLSITSGAGVYFMLESFWPAVSPIKLRHALQIVGGVFWFRVLLVFLLAGAVYPIVASYQRTNHYMQRTNSLDGFAYMQSYDPADYAAIRWLNAHIQGDPVIVEAVGPDYSDYGRVSAFTGLPTLMGWVGHEYQWRVNWLNKDYNAADFYRRGNDINSIYTDKHPEVVLELMARYSAQYLYVGPLEQELYFRADLQRFSTFMQVVYAANGVTIYKV